MSVLSTGFIKGSAGFLKSGTSEHRAIVSTSPIREIRVGITQVLMVCVYRVLALYASLMFSKHCALIWLLSYVNRKQITYCVF